MAAAGDGDVKEEVLSPKPDRHRQVNPQDPSESQATQRPSQQDPATMLQLPDFAGPITQAGGSMQFISACVEASSDDVLAARLASFFEPKPDLSYAKKDSLQMDDDKELLFRLVDLGYGDATTTKGQPRLHTCLQLIDSILTDGFVTQLDPILVWKNPQMMSQNVFWLSYVKGHSRACTALAMSIILMDRFSDASAVIAAGGGNLLESLKVIRVRVAIVAPDLMAVAFKNALLAHRGAIRQAHDVLNWIQKLEKVSASTGVTPDDVLSKWNSECPAEARVLGNKRVCCMHILRSINHDCRVVLLDHASKFGAKSAFTDDAFTSKRILPGHKPRLPSQRWCRWQTVTHDSFMLMLQHVIQKHETMHEAARCKVSKPKIERASEMASLVFAIKEDVLQTFPAIPQDDIDKTFIDAFITNDPNLLMALEAALCDKDNSFDVMQMPILNDVITQCQSKALEISTGPPPQRMKVDATQLEEQEFKLWKIRVGLDLEQFTSWQAMTRDKDTQSYYKKVQHNVWRATECFNAASSLFDPSHKNCCVALCLAIDERSFVKTCSDMKKHLVRSHVLPGPESFITLAYLNWTAMSLFGAKMTKIQHGALAETLRLDGGNSLGLVLLPTFTYRKGLLYKQEAEAQSAVAAHGVYIDNSICLHFTEQVDSRVEWKFSVQSSMTFPLMIPGMLSSWLTCLYMSVT